MTPTKFDRKDLREQLFIIIKSTISNTICGTATDLDKKVAEGYLNNQSNMYADKIVADILALLSHISAPEKVCPECKGTGEIFVSAGLHKVKGPCDNCHGTGQAPEKVCAWICEATMTMPDLPCKHCGKTGREKYSVGYYIDKNGESFSTDKAKPKG